MFAQPLVTFLLRLLLLLPLLAGQVASELVSGAGASRRESAAVRRANGIVKETRDGMSGGINGVPEGRAFIRPSGPQMETLRVSAKFPLLSTGAVTPRPAS